MTISTTPSSTDSLPDRTRPVAIWLLSVAALVALMVVVGGLTRLTESGLSITEWKPVTGAIPPLSAEVWEEEFDKYRQIPQYQLVNKGMSLDEFKTIYWWEWGHRFLGRLIGLAFFVPFVWFLATGRLRGQLAWTCAGLFILGGLQGALGWYMVASGLT
jgi:cytochrome c oxidase assembly protein subunit 15